MPRNQDFYRTEGVLADKKQQLAEFNGTSLPLDLNNAYRRYSTSNASIPRSGNIQGLSRYSPALSVPKDSCVETSSWI